MDYQIVKASILHVKPMAARMRAASVIGLEAYGVSPRPSLRQAFVKSFYCRTALVDGKPIAMWGVAGTLLADTAEPWLVLSNHAARMPIAVVKEARRELRVMMSGRESLVTAMIPDDDAAIRFGVYLGFGDGNGGTRHEMEQRIKSNPAIRVSYGDTFVIPLTYGAGNM